MKINYYFFILVLTVVSSCKKNSSVHDPILVSKSEKGVGYVCNLDELFTFTKNSGGFDTSFSFTGRYIKTTPFSSVVAPFSSINFNGHIADASNNFNGDISSCPNFLQLADHATWNVVSPEFGNFQFIDSTAMPRLVGSSITIPSTFNSAHGIPISISGIQNAGSLSVINIGGGEYFDDTYNQLRTFQTTGVTTINDTIRDQNFEFLPTNTTLTLSIQLETNTQKTINGYYFNTIRKYTTYNYYTTKKIN